MNGTLHGTMSLAFPAGSRSEPVPAVKSSQSPPEGTPLYFRNWMGSLAHLISVTAVVGLSQTSISHTKPCHRGRHRQPAVREMPHPVRVLAAVLLHLGAALLASHTVAAAPPRSKL